MAKIQTILSLLLIAIISSFTLPLVFAENLTELSCEGKIPGVTYNIEHHYVNQSSQNDTIAFDKIDDDLSAISASGISCLLINPGLLKNGDNLENIMKSSSKHNLHIVFTLNVGYFEQKNPYFLENLNRIIDLDQKYGFIIEAILVEPRFEQNNNNVEEITVIPSIYDVTKPFLMDKYELKDNFDNIRKIIGERPLIFTWDTDPESWERNYNEFNSDYLSFINFPHREESDPTNFPLNSDYVEKLKTHDDFMFIFQFGVPVISEKDTLVDTLDNFKTVIDDSGISYTFFWYDSFAQPWSPEFTFFDEERGLSSQSFQFLNVKDLSDKHFNVNYGNPFQPLFTPEFAEDKFKLIRTVLSLDSEIKHGPLFESDQLIEHNGMNDSFMIIEPGPYEILIKQTTTSLSECVSGLDNIDIIFIDQDKNSNISFEVMDNCSNPLFFNLPFAFSSESIFYVNFHSDSFQCEDNCISINFKNESDQWDVPGILPLLEIITILLGIIISVFTIRTFLLNHSPETYQRDTADSTRIIHKWRLDLLWGLFKYDGEKITKKDTNLTTGEISA